MGKTTTTSQGLSNLRFCLSFSFQRWQERRYDGSLIIITGVYSRVSVNRIARGRGMHCTSIAHVMMSYVGLCCCSLRGFKITGVTTANSPAEGLPLLPKSPGQRQGMRPVQFVSHDRKGMGTPGTSRHRWCGLHKSVRAASASVRGSRCLCASCARNDRRLLELCCCCCSSQGKIALATVAGAEAAARTFLPSPAGKARRRA